MINTNLSHDLIKAQLADAIKMVNRLTNDCKDLTAIVKKQESTIKTLARDRQDLADMICKQAAIIEDLQEDLKATELRNDELTQELTEYHFLEAVFRDPIEDAIKAYRDATDEVIKNGSAYGFNPYQE